MPDPLRLRLPTRPTTTAHTTSPAPTNTVRRRRRRRHQRLLRIPLFADAYRLCAVVDEAFLEPGVLERLFGVDALFGVVDEDLAEEVQKLFVEGCIGGNEFLNKSVSIDVGRVLAEENSHVTLSWP